jgi:GntP family gluconate:H+ symporter
MSHQTALLLYAVMAVIGLIVLVARFHLHAFLALICASAFVGLCSGMPLPEIARAFQTGVGNTLGFIAVVVGLGTMLGKMLAECGGAEVLARTFIQALGPARLPWAMVAVGFVVGIPVFFAVGLVLLVPILFTLVRDTNTPLLKLAIPMVAGLSAAHGLVPPHPGPMVAIEQLGADIGKTIFYSILIGIPCAIVAGPIFALWLGHSNPAGVSGTGLGISTQAAESVTAPPPRRNPPRFGLTLFTILLPVALMLISTVANLTLSPNHRLRAWADFVGSPLIALLIAVLVSIYTFGVARGFAASEILKFMESCLGPVASILLIVGAGGGFSKVLDVSGTGAAIAAFARDLNVSPLILAWLIAALIRIAVGSATVAVTMTAGIMATMLPTFPGVNRELLVLAMGAGSIILSHLNDGGFWFVKEYLGLTVEQTFKSWTVMETLLSVAAFMLILLLDLAL